MMDNKLSTLFWNCSRAVEYESVGHDVNYAFVEDGSTLYIYFQGSKDLKKKGAFWDWFRNFAFFPKWKVPYKEMLYPFKVHGGFLDAWNEVKKIVIKKICELVVDSKYAVKMKFTKIIIVGYSHGAALSGLCFEACQYWRSDLHESDSIVGYGFESPRFLSCYKVPKEIKDRWKNYHVIRNSKDIVTHCPPRLFRFCHVGQMIKIGKVSKGLIKDHFPENVYNSLLDYEKETCIEK